MSLFKTNPEIFAGGQFQVRDDKGKTCRVAGYKRGGWILCRDVETLEDTWCNVEFIALIARPISDLSYEEVRNFPNYWDGMTESKTRSRWIELAKSGLSFEVAMYLLARQVYPGPQSDFDNGNVIKKS